MTASSIRLRVQVLLCGLLSGAYALSPAPAAPPTDRATASKTVYLADGFAGDELLAFTTAIAAGSPESVVLVHGPKSEKLNRDFLAAFKPERVVPVGAFAQGVPSGDRLGVRDVAAALPWSRGPPDALWEALLPRAESVVVTPAQPYRLRLQAACLAAALRAPLAIVDGSDNDERLARRFRQWQTRTLFIVGDAGKTFRVPEGLRSVMLADEPSIQTACLQALEKVGAVHNVVVTNPADVRAGGAGLSALAPWIAAQRRALLLLTDDDGKNTTALVQQLQTKHPSLRADTLIVVAGLHDIPTERRPNPVPGKDVDIEMEPLTPTEEGLFTFAVGRLFHRTPALLAASLARQRLLERPRGNTAPGGQQSRWQPAAAGVVLANTAAELQNAGYDTTSLFQKDVDGERVRSCFRTPTFFSGRALQDADGGLRLRRVEGTSAARAGVSAELPGAQRGRAQPLFDRGAIAVVGSSTRTYSATGGAFSLAFFDALVYDEQTLGGALRQAKNFLLLYARLKEQRLEGNAKLAGANRRSAWAFTLWGDPTLRLPAPARPAAARAAFRAEVKDNDVKLRLPKERLPTVSVGDYEANPWPNTRLAGLVRPSGEGQGGTLAPLVFAEVRFADDHGGREPRLHTKLPRKRWIFHWDPSRKVGYLLVLPPADAAELDFRASWQPRSE